MLHSAIRRLAVTTVGRHLVARGVPAPARRLIWRTFFTGVSRGVDFDAHLPWHRDPDVRTVLLSDDDDDAIAAAVVRPAGQAGVATVGYVCVDGRSRGQGHGRELIAAIGRAVDVAGYRAALLWTEKPDLYLRHGYAIVGHDDFLRVSRISSSPVLAGRATRLPWPDSGDRAGLPAFATAAYRLRSDYAELVVAQGPRGATVIDRSGDPAAIAALMEADGHDSWMITVPAGDSFADAMHAAGRAAEVLPGAVAMARCADPSFVFAPVPVAERI